MAATDSDLRQASRAIKDATSALTSVLKQAFAEAGSQASREIADELRDVVKDLGDVVFIGAGGGSAPSQRSQKAERTRAELLVAAAKVFAEKGYEGASVGDIAVAAGYTKGAVYANFGSKQDMLLALAQELVAQDAEAVEAENIDLHEFFGLCAEAEGNQSPLLVLELYLYGIRHPEARAELAPVLTKTQDEVAEMVHRTLSPPQSEMTQQDDDTAFALVALHTYGSIMARLAPDAQGYKDTASTVDRLIGRLLAS